MILKNIRSSKNTEHQDKIKQYDIKYTSSVAKFTSKEINIK